MDSSSDAPEVEAQPEVEDASDAASSPGRQPVTFRSLLAITALIIAIITIPLIAHRQDEAKAGAPHFCKASLHIMVIDGHEVVPQDQGDPGLDGCDLPDHGGYARVLGLDCKIRDESGEVVGTAESDRADRTSGVPTTPR